MSATDVSICNGALTKLGAERIIALSDDSKAARTLNARYEPVRDAELRKHPWKFAIKRTTLPALVDAPAFGYARAFQLPTDYLRLLELGDIWVASDISDVSQAPNAEFAIEGKQILADYSAPLKIRYVARITDPTFFDALFVEALSCRLADECAIDITDSNSKADRAREQYTEAIRDAYTRNSIEKPPQRMADDTWVTARFAG